MRKLSRFAGIMLALTVGITALGATMANAEAGSVWKINGANNTSTLKPQLQITELETLAVTGVKEDILLTKVGLSKIEKLCTALKFVDALLGLTGSATGKLHLEGCVTKLNGGAPSGACKPHSPGAAEGLIETNKLKVLTVLHTPAEGSKEELLEVTPESGTVLVDIRMGKEVGSECSIGTHFEITGKVVLKAGTKTELKEETVGKLFSEGPLSGLSFGGNAMTLDGSAKVALVGPHGGIKWSGLAG